VFKGLNIAFACPCTIIPDMKIFLALPLTSRSQTILLLYSFPVFFNFHLLKNQACYKFATDFLSPRFPSIKLFHSIVVVYTVHHVSSHFLFSNS